MLETTLALSGAAFLAGLIDSVAGGGGLITVPAMLLAGLPPQVALGTSKFVASLGTSAALINFARSGLVYWRMALLGVLAALAGSYAGSLAILAVSPEAAGRVVVLLLPFGLAATLFPRRGRELAEPDERRLKIHAPVVCFAVGFYDGFFGPGAGSMYILAFHFLLGMGLAQASATAKVFNLTSNLGALAAFLLDGKVLLALGLPMAAANIAGNWLGSRLTIAKGAPVVRAFLVVSLGILFVTLAWKYFLTTA